jgi:hypothetical protein
VRILKNNILTKKFIFAASFLCVTIASFCQKLPQFLGIEKDSIYTFYVNVDQKLHIKPRSADLSMIEIKATNAYVYKFNDSTYVVRYNTTTEISKIKLYYKNLPVDIINVQVETMPAPAIILGGNQGPNLTQETLRNLKKLDIQFPLNKSSLKALELFQCRMLITEPGKPITFNTNLGGSVLPDHISKMLAELKPKSTIRFDEFKIKTEQNYVLDVEGSSITFIVVE